MPSHFWLIFALALQSFLTSLGRASSPVETRTNSHDDGASECLDDQPLLGLSWDRIGLQGSSTVQLGKWQLPPSYSNTSVLTQAFMELELVWNQQKQHWEAVVSFTYGQPGTFALFFTFQRIEMEWISEAGQRQAAIEDWHCPGRSLISGRNWSVVIALPGTKDSPELKQPVLRLWGAQF